MAAIGFGSKVTGGDGATADHVYRVTSGANAGSGTLDAAFDDVRRLDAGTPAMIVVARGVTVERRAATHKIKSKNLTIIGEQNSEIVGNLLEFECTDADNIIIQNLKFTSETPGDETDPRDTIHINGMEGRGPIGFWIDHCTFEAFYDLNITSNVADLAPDVKPLLITISNCHFHNDHPAGRDHRNNGAIGIHGFVDKDGKNKNTDAYATVCRNSFQSIRRRSPRSSGKCYVHAFNNVLDNWGADPQTNDQVNGMESGHEGFLVAEANAFDAGPLPLTINVSTTKGEKGRLLVPDNDDMLKNLYDHGAVAATSTDMLPPSTADAYAAAGITAVPTPEMMTPALRTMIKQSAGAFRNVAATPST